MDRTSHADLAEGFAERGFTVAAPTHPDVGGLESGDGALDPLLLRPRHVSLTVDAAIEEANKKTNEPFNTITVIGHSIGGYTALRIAGAEVNTDGLPAHCDANPSDEILCSPTARTRFETVVDADAGSGDPRVDQVVLLAPGYGPLFSPEALGEVAVPVLIVGAEDDVELPGNQVEKLVDDLPADTRFQTVAGGHFIFVRTCTAEEAGVLTDICAETPGVDRSEVHDRLVADVDEFASS